MLPASPFDAAGRQKRKEDYYRFARSQAARVFTSEGKYQPETENDHRIAYWIYGALVSSPDLKEREFANLIYAAAPMWEKWDVFTTSSVAANLVRERRWMTPDLQKRSEEHLARFVVCENGRKPCSGANDYVFQGYNDNMPAMSMRALILAGEILGRKDYLDQGLFRLEGLCAHFERQGLLSEHSSGTYLPISLVAILDLAEYSTTPETREMAAACGSRLFLDLYGYWHLRVGGMCAPQSRANTVDLTETLSCVNALMWYLTGSPMCLNPIEILQHPDYGGPIHHGRNFGYNLAQFSELIAPSYETVSPGASEFASTPRSYPYEIAATTDCGQNGILAGSKEIQTRAFQQPLYGLGTASESNSTLAGQQITLHAVLSRVPDPQTWRDRIPIWHKTITGDVDEGDLEWRDHHTALWHQADVYRGDPKSDRSGALVEKDCIADTGHYKVLQKGGTALVLGSVSPALLDREISRLKFSILFGTFLHMPDEIVEAAKWHFLRFGDVYVGVRATGMVEEQRILAQRVVKNKYLRIELPLIEERTVKVTQEFREWCDFGYAFEIAAKDECGSFEAFQEQCLACTWEWYHGFYRTSRYQGRHGELQINDSNAAGTVRFMAIDGKVEPRIKFAATGLAPLTAQLFPDGRRIKQRRLVYWPDHISSPFYPYRNHLIEDGAVS